MKDPLILEIIQITLALALPPQNSALTQSIPQLVLDSQGNKYRDRIN